MTACFTVLRAKIEGRRSILLAQAQGTDSRADAEALAIRADEDGVILGLLADNP